MAAKSNDINDIYNWINSIIESCTNPEQEKCIYNLIRNFEKLAFLKTKNKFYVDKLCNELNVKIINHVH